MAQDNCQKIKLLRIYEMLRQETDEQHPMKTHEICERLSAQGISCDRRTLAKDMKLLNEQGFEVMHHLIGHEKAYYIEDRSFSIPELKILMDAVQAASFITDKKSKELISKIAVLGGSYCAEILTGNLIQFSTSITVWNVLRKPSETSKKPRFCTFTWTKTMIKSITETDRDISLSQLHLCTIRTTTTS